MKVNYLDIKELCKQLDVDKDNFHIELKVKIKADFRNELIQINTKNPDIGIDENFQLYLRNPLTKREIFTKININEYL